MVWRVWREVWWWDVVRCCWVAYRGVVGWSAVGCYGVLWGVTRCVAWLGGVSKDVVGCREVLLGGMVWRVWLRYSG